MNLVVKKILKLFHSHSLPRFSVERTGRKPIKKPRLPTSILLSSLILNLLGLALPLCILQVYDRILPNQASETLFFLILGLLGVIIVDTVIKVFRSKMLLWVSASFAQATSVEAFRRILNAPPSKVESSSLSVHMNRLNALNSLGDYYGGSGRLLVIDLPSAFIYLGIMYLIGGTIVIVPIVLLLLFLVITFRQSMELRDIVLLRSDQNNRKYDFVIEALQGIHTVKSMAMEALMLRRFERLQKQVGKLCYRSILMSSAAQNSGALYATLSTVFIVSIGAVLVISGELSIGVVAACTLLSGQLIQPLIRGLSAWVEIQSVRHSFKEGIKLFDLPLAAKDDGHIKQCKGELTFEDMTYESEELDRPVIENMSLSCSPGSITGFNIADPSERYALIQLLCGYLKPTQGKILVDGQDFNNEENCGLRQWIAYVGPNPATFKGSIIDNLTMFDQKADSHAARRATQLLGLEHEINRLPEGYDTRLGEGVYEDLPKPIIQWITIARAVASEPKILVLDNITKSLDAPAISACLEAFKELKKNTTIILISDNEQVLNIADKRLQIWGGHIHEENDTNHEAIEFESIKYSSSENDSSENAPAIPEMVTSNPVHSQLSKLEKEFGISDIADENENLPAAQLCLDPLLMALGWHGVERHLYESLPHFDTIDTMEDLRGVLVKLNYLTDPIKTNIAKLKPEMLPCLFESDGTIYVLLGYEEDGSLSVFDSSAQDFVDFKPKHRMKGTAYILSPIERKEEDNNPNWLFDVIIKFRRIFVMMFGLGFISNLLALALPIYVMMVYDKAISANSSNVLISLSAGILLVIFFDAVIRSLRAKAQAYFGARLDELISNQAFSHLMHMQVRMTEAASIGGQITRLRLLESVREAFTGPLAGALIDAPFILIFITAIILIGGVIAVIPLALVGVYALMLAITVPMMRRHSNKAGESKSKLQNLVIEALNQQRAIRGVSAENVWIEMFQHLSADHAFKNLKMKTLNFTTQTLSQSFVQITGIATLGVGALLVMQGSLSAGALIAVMALSWRVLNPLHQAFVSLTQLGDALQSLEQVNKLMRIPLERIPNKLPSVYRTFQGQIDVNRLVFTYPGTSEPIIRGMTFSVKPGELVAIAGGTGSGKSTILKVLLGLYPIQGGSVLVDGIDVRQLDPGEWRHAIGYIPKTLNLFYGSIAQNMRLANPTATHVDIALIAEELGLLDGEYEEFLPEGVDTKLTSKLMTELPEDLKQRILLARSLIKPAPIYLYDSPSQKLNKTGMDLLIKKLLSQRGQATVMMVTQEKSLIEISDKVIYMKDGQVLYDGDPETMIKKISRAA